MTPEELKAARRTLGLSAEGFARLVRVEIRTYCTALGIGRTRHSRAGDSDY